MYWLAVHHDAAPDLGKLVLDSEYLFEIVAVDGKVRSLQAQRLHDYRTLPTDLQFRVCLQMAKENAQELEADGFEVDAETVQSMAATLFNQTRRGAFNNLTSALVERALMNRIKAPEGACMV